MGVRVKILVATAALAALLPASALGAYPGSNGKIAFERGGQIWSMNADGTGQVQLTAAANPSSEPQWSPDGRLIAYVRTIDGASEVRMMNADGSGDVLVRPGNGSTNTSSPTWSPDASRIGWVETGINPPFYPYVELSDSSPEGTEQRLIWLNADMETQSAASIFDTEWSPRGDGIAHATDAGNPFAQGDLRTVVVITTARNYPDNTQRQISRYDAFASEPAWSPNATQLVFLEQERDPDLGEPVGPRQIYKINEDGTGRTQLTSDPASKSHVEWSPDGTKVLFAKGDLWVMNPDGTNQTQITNTAAEEHDPDWQPVVPPSAVTGYPRPKHTAPLRISLVPAYKACSNSNRTHGPPLAFPSCAPPQADAAYVTTGSPDANGAPAGLEGRLEVKARPGNPATAADEADIALDLNVTDVRCSLTDYPCDSANSAGPPDYQGTVYIQLALRITDRYNLPAPGGRLSGTAVDIPSASWYTSCRRTTDTSTGGTCQARTTLDALTGGTVIEGRRSNIELGQVELHTQSGDVFLRQGIFIP